MKTWTWTNGGGWTSCSALLCPASTFGFCKVLKNPVLVLLGPQRGDPGGLGASDDLGKDASQGPRGGNSQLCSSLSQGKAQGFSSQRTLPLRLQPHARTLQAASFITPVWTVLFLVAELDCRDTGPIPTLELISTAGSQRCQERSRGEGQSQHGVGTAFLSPPHSIANPWQEQNLWLSMGVLEGHLTKALAVYRWETEAQRGGRPHPGSHSTLAGRARTKTQVSCFPVHCLSPGPPLQSGHLAF